MHNTFLPLATDRVQIMRICGLSSSKYMEWKHRENVITIFKQYNMGKGKVSKKQVVQKLMRISGGEYTQAIKNLMDYVESVWSIGALFWGTYNYFYCIGNIVKLINAKMSKFAMKSEKKALTKLVFSIQNIIQFKKGDLAIGGNLNTISL